MRKNWRHVRTKGNTRLLHCTRRDDTVAFMRESVARVKKGVEASFPHQGARMSGKPGICV